MNIMSNFAEILGELLLERNLNAKQFAHDIDAQNSSVSFYLRAMSIPTVKWLVKIADYFNCSTDYLLGLDEEKKVGDFCVCPPFNEQLNFLKQHFNCSNSYFYTNSGIPKTRYYDWQNGKRVPTVESVVKLAKHFDCSVDFIIGRSKI